MFTFKDLNGDEFQHIEDVHFTNMSPQQAIKYLKDMINRIAYPEKRWLVLKTYKDYHGYYNNPDPTEQLCLCIRKIKPACQNKTE